MSRKTEEEDKYMSHIARCKTELKNVNRELLKQIIKLIAAKKHGSTVTIVQDYYGHNQKVDIGFKTPEFQRGIGIVFNQDGNVEFIYDDFGCEEQVSALKSEIVQTYTAEAVAAALNALGYKVEAQEYNKQIILTGVKG